MSDRLLYRWVIEFMRTKRDLLRLSASIIILLLFVSIYPHIVCLWRLRTFFLGFVWGIVLASTSRINYTSIYTCIIVGIIGFGVSPLYDIISFPTLGCVAAFMVLPVYSRLSTPSCSYVLGMFLYRIGRAALSLLAGILFLSLPIPRNPAIGEYSPIEATFSCFAGLAMSMIVPIIILDQIVFGCFVKSRVKKTHNGIEDKTI